MAEIEWEDKAWNPQADCDKIPADPWEERLAEQDEAEVQNRARGDPASFLEKIGHSNGGMLAVKHVSDHPETPAMVLLSAHGVGMTGFSAPRALGCSQATDSMR